jgi:hypothetical protein
MRSDTLPSGHKTATLTWDRYGHLYPDDLDAVADAFDSAAYSGQSQADGLDEK